MKTTEIKFRVDESLKQDFQDICDNEKTNMSVKLTEFMKSEVVDKKEKPLSEVPFTTQLLHFGVMNKHGRLYNKKDILNVRLDKDGLEYTELDRLNTKPFYGQFGFANSDSVIHKYNATHVINHFRIKDEWLVGDVTLLNQSLLPILDKLVFRPRAYGNINRNKIVDEMEIIGFDAIVKTEDTFRNE